MIELSTIVALLVALSVASERLVEIVKGITPFLNQQNADPKKEGWRKATLQAIAVVAGVATVLVAQPVIADVVSAPWGTYPGILALGFLASGGSGFWNSIQTYVLNLKDIKKLEVKKLTKKK